MEKEQLLEDLTEEQRAAVKHGAGPCLVIAGAGTGKTRVLTHRIAYLIASKKAKAEQILALTFTEKAAAEMAGRADQLLPLGTNYATITTFHSFTTDILRQNAHLIGLPADFALLTPEEELVLIRDHLFDLPLKTLRPTSNPTKFLTKILGFFNRLKDEAIDAAALDDYSRPLLKSAEAADRDEGQIYQELAAAFAAYETLLKKEGYLTFGHCITETLRLFKAHPSVLRDVQKRFKFILIDEYQDTNWAQTELAVQLAGQTANIMVVGDDDQAIYQFRGAASANLLAFAQHYAQAKRVVLTQNFRSTQEILDAAYRLIQQNNPDRLEYQEKIDKRLYAQTTGRAPELLRYDRLSSELSGIVQQVKEWLAEGLAPPEIAVLVRTHNHAATISQALKNAGLSVNSQESLNLFREPIIAGALAFLKLLIDRDQNLAFYNVLATPPFKIDPVSLNKLLASIPYKRDSYFEHAAMLVEIKPGWLEAKDLEKIAQVLNLHQKISPQTGERPSVSLLHYIHQSGLYAQLLAAEKPENLRQLELLGRLFEEMTAYEERHRNARLSQYLEYIAILEDEGKEENLPPEPNPFSLNVMTVHQSKGLEFAAVIVPHGVVNRFPLPNRKDPFVLPEKLKKGPKTQGDVHLEEERRLFYVAATRAQKYLLFTAADRYGEANRVSKLSPFVIEALGETAATQSVQQTVTPKEYLQFTLDLTASSRPTAAAVSAAQRPDQPLTVSQSQLETFIRCPYQYRFQYVLRVKIYPKANLNFGNTMHNTLRAFFDAKKRGEKPDILALLDQYWISGGFLSREEEKETKEEGRVALKKIALNLADITPEKLEWNFKFIWPTGDKLNGRIDRIDRHPDGEVSIVDYKTGGVKELNRVKDDLQLGVYALAVEKNLPAVVKEVKLHFVMSDTTVVVPRAELKTDKIVDKINTALTGLHESLAKNEFEAKPEMNTCQFCDYRSICPFRYT